MKKSRDNDSSRIPSTADKAPVWWRLISRLMAVLISLLLLLFILESAIRITGHFYNQPRRMETETEEWRNRIQGKRIILAIGDSMTYGVGSSVGMDYPSQLEKLLNQETDGDPFVVINAGIGGANTTMILERLPHFLELVNPEYAVLLAGCTNRQNFYGLGAFQNQEAAGTTLTDMLFRFRTFRFLQLIFAFARERAQDKEEIIPDGLDGDIKAYYKWHNRARRQSGKALAELPDAFNRGCSLLRIGATDDAVDAFAKGLDRESPDSSILWGMGMAMGVLRMPEIAEQWFRKAIAVDPQNPNHYYGIGLLYIDNPAQRDLAKKMFLLGIEVDPDFSGNHWGCGMMQDRRRPNRDTLAHFMDCVAADPNDSRCYPNMIHEAFISGKTTELIAFLEQFDKVSQVAHDSLYLLRSSSSTRDISDWVRSDLKRILDLLEEHGVLVIVQNYPYADTNNDILKMLAWERNLPFTDHYQVFTALLRQGATVQDLFAADQRHCNDKGYRVMAATLLQVMKEHQLVAQPAE